MNDDDYVDSAMTWYSATATGTAGIYTLTSTSAWSCTPVSPEALKERPRYRGEPTAPEADLTEAEKEVLKKARELARLSALNQRFRGWDREIASVEQELAQLARGLK